MIFLGLLLPLLQATEVAAMDPLPWPKEMQRRGQNSNAPTPILLSPLHLANTVVDASKPINHLEYVYGSKTAEGEDFDAFLKLDLNSEVIALDSDKLGYDVLCEDRRRSLETAPMRLKIRFAEDADHHQILDSWAAKARKVKRSNENQNVVFAAKVPGKCVSNSTEAPEAAEAQQLTFLTVPAGEMSESLRDHARMLKRDAAADKSVGFEVGVAKYEDIVDDVTINIGKVFSDGHNGSNKAKRQDRSVNPVEPVEPVRGDVTEGPGRVTRMWLSVAGFFGGAIEKFKNWWGNLFNDEPVIPDPADIKHRTIDLNWTPDEQFESEAFPGHMGSTIIPRIIDNLAIECLDCYAKGEQAYSMWLHFSLRNPTKPFDLKFWLDGSLELNINAGMVVYGKVNGALRIALVEIGLHPFWVPGFFNWGPMMSLEYEAGVIWESEAKGIIGMNLNWPQTSLRVELDPVDALNPIGEPIERIEGEGWNPESNYTVQLMGSKGTFDMYTGFSFNIKFGISLMSGVLGMWDVRASDRYTARAGMGYSFTDMDWQAQHPNQTWENPESDLINLLPDCEGWQMTAGFRYERFLQAGTWMRKTFFRKDSTPRGYCMGESRTAIREQLHQLTLEP